MSDSGRQHGDCRHGKTREWCVECLRNEISALREEAAWVRKKLDLPADAPMFSGGGDTLAGKMHVVCSHAHGYKAYILAHKCDDKQGEIARLKAVIREVVTQKADEVCWMDAYVMLGKFVGVDVTLESLALLPTETMLHNCERYIDSLKG